MKKIVFPSHDFEQFLIDSARGYDNKILVYIDGEDPRTAAAAKRFLKFFSSKLIFLGDKNIIKDKITPLYL